MCLVYALAGVTIGFVLAAVYAAVVTARERPRPKALPLGTFLAIVALAHGLGPVRPSATRSLVAERRRPHVPGEFLVF